MRKLERRPDPVKMFFGAKNARPFTLKIVHML
ncbi:MAG: hypothetical protein DMG12_22300 [Acidobacteria bacterium]|nr:MAG: hypothetical protein DMG12_22300 [Acidobacteriota bacterium]